MNLYIRLFLVRLRAYRRQKLSVWETARTPFRVTLTDLDLLGHVNNGKYLSILDLGRVDLLLRSGLWAKIAAQKWYPVVAGQTITYRKSLKLGQKFDVYTRIAGFDDRWVYLEQTFRVGSTVHATAAIRSTFLKKSGGSVQRHELETLVGEIPDQLRVPESVLSGTAALPTPG
ncbi:acyl-CoA thioesterase [Rhodococcus sp. 06-1460-1B]|uniref:acyl-CoA thioesterase n=1 Tax=Rhodococcus sp. 06-1460-1B TaxID=2022501 RepID=UPI000B9A1AC6|nr:acyl-CoA thioesterase [Rhodococcus sp. 06-1460-1B]OZD61915.1 thioesterase [Rhodococcus sp. 06-1460-1B]